MESITITPDGKRIVCIDLTVSPEPKKARKIPVAAGTVTARVALAPPLEGVPQAQNFLSLPSDEWQYWLPGPQDPMLEEYVPPFAPLPKDFLAADLSGSDSEHEDEPEDVDSLATRYPKRTYLHVPYTAKETAKELGAKWDNDKRKWYVYKINPHHDRLVDKFGK